MTLLLSVSGVANAAVPAYRLQTLDNTGLQRGFATNINDNGLIVGYGQLGAGSYHAMKWANNTRTDLGALQTSYSLPGLDYSVAADTNKAGLIVGTSIKETDSSNHPYRAVSWQNGTVAELPALSTPANGGSEAHAVNNKNQIVGSSQTDVGPYYPSHAVLWQNGQATDLGTLGGLSSYATDINDFGQVVGYSLVAPNDYSTYRAFLWDKGYMRDLGTLGGRSSFASSINNKGQIAGYGDLPEGQSGGAFVWKNGVMQNLGVIELNPSGGSSAASSINDNGEVVGYSTVKNYKAHPFIWKQGVMKDLLKPTDDDTDIRANAINSKGVIVGQTSTGANDDKAIFWSQLVK